MRSVAKVLLVALATLILLCGAALVALRSIDLGPYADRLTAPLGELSGRQVEVAGSVRLEAGFPIRLSAEEVSFGNAAWGSRPAMATANRVAASLRSIPLLRGEIEIAGIVIDGLDLSIERNQAGEGNWQIGRRQRDDAAQSQKPAPVERRRSTFLPHVARVELRDARVLYRDAALSEPVVADVARMQMQSLSADTPLQIALEADGGGLHTTFEGKSNPPPTWASEGFALNGTIDLSVVDSAKVAAAIGFQPSALAGATLSAAVDFSPQALALREIAVRMGASDLGGELLLSWKGKRPRLTGGLKSESFFREELLAGSGGQAQPDHRRAASSSTALGWEALTPVDADVSMSAANLHLRSGVAVADVVAHATLTAGELDLSGRVGAAGKGHAEVKVHAESAAKRVRFDVRAADVSIERLVSGDSARGAKLSADLRLSGQGATRRAITRSLEGSALVEISGGTFNQPALDLFAGDLVRQIVEAVNPKARSSGPTRLVCAVARARVRNGVLELDKGIAVETEGVKVLGAGTLDLVSGEIDLALRMDPKGGTGVSVATVVDSLIRIRGTYEKPKIEIDPIGTVRAALRIGGVVLSRGLSLIDDLIQLDLKDDVSPCLIARGDSPGRKSTVEGVADTAGEVGKAVGKGAGAAGRKLKKLLGR